MSTVKVVEGVMVTKTRPKGKLGNHFHFYFPLTGPLLAGKTEQNETRQNKIKHSAIAFFLCISRDDPLPLMLLWIYHLY